MALFTKPIGGVIKGITESAGIQAFRQQANTAWAITKGMNWGMAGKAALKPMAIGAGIGAVAGGIEGGISDRDTVLGSAFKGALVGGAIGGGVGAGKNLYSQFRTPRLTMGTLGLPGPGVTTASRNSKIIEQGLFY